MSLIRPFALTQAARAHSGAGPLICLAFAVGIVAGGTFGPLLTRHAAAPIATALAAAPAGEAAAAKGDGPTAHRVDPHLSYPAEVIRVIDGDTFEARVRVWPGLDVDTKIRLRDVDAAELHARCAGELAQAQAARTALEAMLADGGVGISGVGVDKDGGRVDAAVSTRNTADVSAALLKGGNARSYGGGKRGSWCG